MYRTGSDTNKPIVLYEYQPGRDSTYSKTFLAGLRIYLHIDSYSGYHDLSDEITVVGCWAYARQKFDEAVKALPKGKAKGYSSTQVLTYCNKLFEIEKNLCDPSPEERYIQRLEQTKPVVDDFFVMGKYQNSNAKICPG